MTDYFCPVCWRPVDPTPAHLIMGHFDTAPEKATCPGAYQPFYIALVAKPPKFEADFPRQALKWWPKRHRKGSEIRHLEAI